MTPFSVHSRTLPCTLVRVRIRVRVRVRVNE